MKRNPWICRLGAPVATIGEVLAVGGLVMGFVAWLVWLGPPQPPQEAPTYPFVVFGHTWHATSLDNLVLNIALTALLGIAVIGASGIILGMIVAWNYRKCHDYWYPEEKKAREHAEALRRLAPLSPELFGEQSRE